MDLSRLAKFDVNLKNTKLLKRKSCVDPDLDIQDDDNEFTTSIEDAKDAKSFLTPSGELDMHDFLEKMAKVYIRKAVQYAKITSLSVPAVLKVASLCAGSGTGEMTVRVAVNELSDHFMTPYTMAEVCFCCEKETWKQQHLAKHIVDSSTCIFDDVVTLGSASTDQKPSDQNPADQKQTDHKPKCVQHKKPCDPLRHAGLFLLKSGFSCKGNSRMNVRFAEFRKSMANGDFSNTSVSTFYGTLGVIEWAKPKLFILENVDSAGCESAQDSNLSKIVEELRSVDDGLYATYTYHLCTEEYLLPQSRTDVLINQNSKTMSSNHFTISKHINI